MARPKWGSTTAQRGALDWFKKFRDASKPVFEDLYHSVKSGEETRRTLEVNSRTDYREQLEKELAANLIAVDCPWGLNKGHLGEL